MLTSEVEDRIHKALAPHRLERIDGGYRVVHPLGAGISTLRLLPGEGRPGSNLAGVAEITAEYGPAGMPVFHAEGVQRLNSWAVHGAYQVAEGHLRQKAQWSLYSDEPEIHFAVQAILNAFGAQLPLGRSTALATGSAAVLKQQRAHHAMPSRWPNPLDEHALTAAADALRRRGLAASNSATAVWAELPLSGDCPSRALDPKAETALLQVNLGGPHPVAGAGYLATISLPLQRAAANTVANAAETCRRLNELEFQQLDFVPRLGAWGLHPPDDLPGYSCFVPTPAAQEGMHMALMGWCVRRAVWLRDGYWQAGVGIAV